MFDFKNFEDWIPIFKGGKQTDSKGREHDGDEVIKKAIETFNPEYHEPPITIGHPEENSPAYGWIEALKKVGDILYAKPKQVASEFKDWVKSGLFKKVSASFYTDGRLRHVGFLGATIPAVKGLPEIKFKEGDAITFDFYDPEMGAVARMFSRMRDFIIEKFDLETADKVLPDYDIDYLKEKSIKEDQPAASYQEGSEDNKSQKKGGEDMSVKEKLKSYFSKTIDELPEDISGETEGKIIKLESKTFSEDEIKKREEAAAKKEREKVESEFAEKEKEKKIEAAKKEASDFIDSLVKEGKVLPAWNELGLKKFMEELASEDSVIEFSEDKKQTRLDFMKALINELPKVINFEEIAKKGKQGPDSDEEKREQMIQDYMEKSKANYKEAVLAVSNKHPDLFKRE